MVQKRLCPLPKVTGQEVWDLGPDPELSGQRARGLAEVVGMKKFFFHFPFSFWGSFYLFLFWILQVLSMSEFHGVLGR